MLAKYNNTNRLKWQTILNQYEAILLDDYHVRQNDKESRRQHRSQFLLLCIGVLYFGVL